MKLFSKLLAGAIFIVIAGLSVGIGISIAPQLQDYLTQHLGDSMVAKASIAKAPDANEPKYWVAPMDPNYRRDGPGKSPMGMDLVPVYEDSGEQLPAGTVKINPAVVHNLGVRTALVEHDSLDENISTIATVKFDERQLQVVHSRVSGWIKSLTVRADGDEVERYQRLYDIYSPELIAAQEELLIALNAGESGMRAASIEKLKNLGVSQGSINHLIKNRKIISNITVYAPASGVVSDLGVGQGAYVTPNTRIMSISGMDPIWVEGEVFESDLHKLRLGAEVAVSSESIPGRSWLGSIDYIHPQIDAKSRTAKIRVIIKNPDKSLLANMYVRILINTSSPDKTLAVAQEAVIRTGSMERVVLVTAEGNYKSVKVRTGRRASKKVEILEGLEEGDKVVISAQFLIDSESSISSDFMRMTALEEEPETAWATGTIEDIYDDEGVMLINHEPVPEWQWPSMQMEFSYTPETNIEQLKSGSPIRFNMRKLDSGEILIEAIEPQSGASS